MVVFGAFANVYGKHTFGKVAILPTGACAVLPSQQGCFAGMLMNPQTRRAVLRVCCSKKNAFRSTCVPLASEGGRLQIFSVNADFMRS